MSYETEIECAARQIDDWECYCTVTPDRKALAKKYLQQLVMHESLRRDFDAYGLQAFVKEVIKTPYGEQIESGLRIDDVFKNIGRICEAQL